MASTRSTLTSTLLNFYVFSVLLSSWLVYAQNLDFLPACAQKCAESAISASDCKPVTAACLCSNPSFQSAINQCAAKACPNEDLSSTTGALQNYCSQATATTTASNTSANSTPKPSASGTSQSQSTPSQPAQTTNTNTGTSPSVITTTTTTTQPTTPPSSPTTPLTFISLPSSAISSGGSTSVVIQTITGTPTGNAALGVHAAIDGSLAGMLGVAVIGAILGSLMVL